MQKYTIDEKVDFYVKTINLAEGTKVKVGLTPLDVDKKAFKDDNNLDKTKKDVATVKKDEDTFIAEYPFIIKKLAEDLNIKIEEIFYVKGWIDADGSGDEEITMNCEEEVVLEVEIRIDPNKLFLSQKGIDFLKAYESEVKNDGKHVLYNDDAGYCTIGYGHLIGKKSCSSITDIPQEFKNGLSDENAENLFRKDLKYYEGIVKNRVKVNLYQHEFDALVIFVYNIGDGKKGFRGSSLLEKINEKKYDEAPELFSRFTQSGGKIMPGLVLRRKAEAKIFKDAVYDSAH